MWLVGAFLWNKKRAVVDSVKNKLTNRPTDQPSF